MIRDYLIPIALGGLVGGLLVGIFFVWPKVYGAEWWEAFTAFGTVGAVSLALFQDLFKRQEGKRRLQETSKIFSRKVELEREMISSILAHRGDSFEIKSQKIKNCLLNIKSSIPQTIVDRAPNLATYINLRIDNLISLSQGENADSMSDYDQSFNEFKSRYNAELQEVSAILEGVLSL